MSLTLKNTGGIDTHVYSSPTPWMIGGRSISQFCNPTPLLNFFSFSDRCNCVDQKKISCIEEHYSNGYLIYRKYLLKA